MRYIAFNALHTLVYKNDKHFALKWLIKTRLTLLKNERYIAFSWHLHNKKPQAQA